MPLYRKPLFGDFCQGRLTLTSGTAITTSDVTGASTIYFTPHKGNRLALYDGSVWNLMAFSELSLALGTLVNAMAYDVFVYDNAGTPTLEATEWKNEAVTMTIAAPCVVTWTAHGMVTGNSVTFTTTGALPTGLAVNTQYFITKINDNTFNLSATRALLAAGTFITTSGTQSGTHTAHGPHARQTDIALQDGVYVKSGATTRRYLGTFLTTSTTTTEDSVLNRLLWNQYNQEPRMLRIIEATDTWAYSTTTYRQANANVANQVNIITGNITLISLTNYHTFATSANGGRTAIGEDLVNTVEANCILGLNAGTLGSGQANGLTCFFEKYPSIGYHSYIWIERGNTGVTFSGDNADRTLLQTGVTGKILG